MNKTDLSDYNNNWYKKSDFTRGFLLTLLWFFTNRVIFNSYLPIPSKIKTKILRLFGAKMGSNIVFKNKINIKAPWNLEVGNHVWLGECLWIDNLGKVIIGDNACLSQGAMLLSGNHNYKSTRFDLMIADIIIEEGAWIGAKAVVCSGVKCESHSILTVNSVATQNLESYTIYQGNPAQKVRKRNIDR